MIITAIRFIRVASKVATVAWAAKNGYDIYQKGKKVKQVYDKISKLNNVKNKAKKFMK